MAHYRFPQKILFKHCDPAGIVFYPRYYEMLNDAVEAMFSDLLGWPFEDMHKTPPNGSGVPTVRMETVFSAPSRHGDRIELAVTLTRLGASSLGLRTVASAGDEVRFTAEQVLVCVDGHGRPRGWPDAVREKITSIMEDAA